MERGPADRLPLGKFIDCFTAPRVKPRLPTRSVQQSSKFIEYGTAFGFVYH